VSRLLNFGTSELLNREFYGVIYKVEKGMVVALSKGGE